MRYAKFLVAMCIVAVAGAAVGHGSAGSGPEKPKPIAFSPVSASRAQVTPSVGLSDALGRMDADAIVSARIEQSPPGSGQGNLPWLHAIVRVPAMTNGLDVEPMWQADILEGAVADQAGASADIHDDFGGSTFDAMLPDGSVLPDVGGGLGDIVHGQVFPADTSEPDISALKQNLKAAGLSAISIRVLHPLGFAVAVVASTSDVKGTASRYVALVKRFFGDPPTYEGYYLELRGPDGSAVVRASAAFRTGAGRFWATPALANRFGVQTLGRNRTDAVGGVVGTR